MRKLHSLAPCSILSSTESGDIRTSPRSDTATVAPLEIEVTPSSPIGVDKKALLKVGGKKRLIFVRSFTIVLGLLLLVEFISTRMFELSILPFRQGRLGSFDTYQDGAVGSVPPIIPDAIVLIAMGRRYLNTKGTSVSLTLEACLCSLRRLGGYSGNIYIVTDHADELKRGTLELYGAKFLEQEPVQTINQVFFIKCKLLSILPASVKNVLYLDSDIMATAPLLQFFLSVPQLNHNHVGMFNDITTRWGRWDSSEQYHGGLVLMQRSASEGCLAAWCDRMSRPQSGIVGDVEDDQVAMKSCVEEEKSCEVTFMNDRFMRFMTDWRQLLSHRQPAVFSHFTHSARSHLSGSLGWLWRWLALERNVGDVCLDEAYDAFAPDQSHEKKL